MLTFLHLDKKNCKLLKRMFDHAKNSEHNNQVKEFTNYLHLYYLLDSIGPESILKDI